MNQIGIVLLVLALVGCNLGQAQETGDSIVQIAAEVNGLEQLAPSAWMPGTYWEALPGASFAPLPCPPLDTTLPVYSMAIGEYLVDVTGGQLPRGDTVSAMALESNAVVNLINQIQSIQAGQPMMRAMDDGSPLIPGGGGDGGGGGISYTNDDSYLYNTNLFYLTLTNLVGGIAYANAYNATDYVYAIWSSTNLALPFTNWQVETEIFPANGATNCMSFTVENQGRPDLFLRAEDWTGVYLNGLPCWWTFYWYGNLNESSTNVDSGGFATLGYDYAYGYNPNRVSFGIVLTNDYVNTPAVPLGLNILSGEPSFVAVLIDDTNTADAVWQPYTSSNITATIGPANGYYNVNIGLCGSLVSGVQTWETAGITLYDTTPQLTLTSPGSSTVSQSTVQLQGYANRPLNYLTYDISNASGVLTNQAGFLTGQTYDTNSMAYVTNYFECSGVMLASGTNLITLHAADWVGNTADDSFTLIYTPATNAPVVSLVWPVDGTMISGNSFTLQAQVGDPTISVSATIGGNTVSGLVEQSGTAWVQNLPLAAGTNAVTLTASNSFGTITTTNFNVVGNDVGLVINPLPGGQLNLASVTNTGSIGDTNDDVYVNGVEAYFTDTNGDWEADGVPVNAIGTATLHVQVYTGDPTLIAEQTSNQPQPPMVVLASYSGSQFEQADDGSFWGNWAFNWAYDSGGTAAANGYDENNLPASPNYSSSTSLAPDGSGFALPDFLASYFDSSYIIWDYFSVAVPIIEGGYVPEFFQRKSAAQLMIAQSGMQPAGTTNVYLVLASASEYSNPAQPMHQGYPGDLPLPPQWQALNGQAMQDSGLTNALGNEMGAGLLLVNTSTNYIVPYSITQFYANPAASIDTLIVTNPISIVDANTGSNLTTGINTVIVGQQMNLRCQVNATNFTATNFQWSVPGYAISNYVVAADSSSAVVVTNFPTNNAGVLYYWADRARSLVVQCTATLNGNTVAAQAVFNVYKPWVRFTDGPPAYPMLYGGWMELGDDTLAQGNMTFAATVTSTNGFAGTANWTQLNNRTASYPNASQDTYGQYWLDNSQFYNDGVGEDPPPTTINPRRTIYFKDAPGVTDDNIPESITDAFETYLVFKPDNINNQTNIWVPLGIVTWGWSASKSFLSFTATNVTQATYTNSSEFPQWTNVGYNKGH